MKADDEWQRAVSRAAFVAAARRRAWCTILAVLVYAAGLCGPAAADSSVAEADAATFRQTFATRVEPLLARYCYDCHGGGASEGGRTLDGLAAADDQLHDHELWLAVWTNLRSDIMPPSDADGPTEAERRELLDWIEREIFRLDPDRPDPGRVVLRRLNRQEYRHTVFDLLAIEFDTTDEFPADDTGYGFDTIAEVLNVSPLLMEKYLRAALQIAGAAIPDDAKDAGPDEDLPAGYRRIFFDGSPPEPTEEREEYRTEILRRFASRAFRRPVDEATLTRLTELAVESERVHGLAFEQGIARAVAAILASPRFLFRVESTEPADDQAFVVKLDEYSLASRLSYFLWSSAPDEALLERARQEDLRRSLHAEVDRMLTDDRAERFIENFVGQWLQTRDVEGIHVDAEYLLKHEKSELSRRDFDRRARRAMRRETEFAVTHVFRENRSLDELITADYTFLNERLARIYGIPGVEGDKMRKVDLPDGSHRGGILRHASMLLVTSNPRRTSPVKRGLFLLDNVLGTPAPPAPPDVPQLEETMRKVGKFASMQELMEQHREDPLCSSCHSRMDPLGLALENYTALGIWRDDDRGDPIEVAGQLITGESFANVDELASLIVKERQRDYYRCLTEKLFTFAIGRGVEYYDATAIDQIVDALQEDGGKARTLLYGIVDSVAFQNRRGPNYPEREDQAP